MTIPEACSLVLQTGGVGKNGISYLLDMGEPVKIKYLAEQIILFSGLEPYKDIDIQYTGPRKGERITEPLWLKEEEPSQTEYPKILELKNLKSDFNLEELISKLSEICIPNQSGKTVSPKYRDAGLLKKILSDEIPSLKEAYEKNKNEVQQ